MPARVMRAVLIRALADAPLVDQAKKALMYGKDKPELASFREAILVTREMKPGIDYPYTDFDRIHAALGMRSEADEILQHELAILNGHIVDNQTLISFTDEVGDLLWYMQLYLRSFGSSVVHAIKLNTAKLLKRYPDGGFNATHATNPDKAAESAAQQEASSPAMVSEETARHYAEGQDFYRGIVTEIGELFGDEAKISDDGSLQDSVLALKVPGLVKKALGR